MDRTDYIAATAYVRRTCVASAELAAAVGVPAARIEALAEAGVAPQPTYRITGRAVVSAIGAVGEIAEGETAAAYYGPSVAPWLRRALVLAEGRGGGLKDPLLDWLAGDLAAALEARAEEARAFGWNHVFCGAGCDPRAVRDEVAGYWDGWMRGGWAVCLVRFDGHHLATKEIERRRMARLTQEAGPRPGPETRLALLDAMARLDAVLLPFAPHERTGGTPGLFIDEPARRFALPWPSPARTAA